MNPPETMSMNLESDFLQNESSGETIVVEDDLSTILWKSWNNLSDTFIFYGFCRAHEIALFILLFYIKIRSLEWVVC